MKSIKSSNLLILGMFIPLVFWVTTILCGLILGNYNHFVNLVSEPGALGTNTQYIFTTGLLLCSFLSLQFVFTLVNKCKKLHISPIPVYFILAFTFSIGGAALFPLPLRMHLYMGMPSILLVLSPLSSVFLWRNTIPYNIGFSVVSLAIMSLGFLTYFPELLGAFPGLKQRFFHVGWSLWFCYLSIAFSKLTKAKA